MTELFNDVLGQPAAVNLLKAALWRGRLAPAYVFVGPDGVGRRLVALRFLEGVVAGPNGSAAIRRRLTQGNHPDLLWVEPTYSHKGELVPVSLAEAQGVNRRSLPQLRLEQVRQVTRFLAGRPVQAPSCLAVLEGVEAMAEPAANALLKTLEEPGDGLLILITCAADRLLATIRSRCQMVRFVGLPSRLVAQVLAQAKTEFDRNDAGQAEDAPELLELAAGSPGALLHHRREWAALPEGLSQRLLNLDLSPLEVLSLARDVSASLDLEQQLWLLSWWQLVLWRKHRNAAIFRRLEVLKGHLKGHVQPRLAWEVALLELVILTKA